MQKNIVKKIMILLLIFMSFFSFNKVLAYANTDIKTINNTSSYNRLLVDDLSDIEVDDADPVFDCKKLSSFKYIWNFMYYMAPFLLIIFGSIDYFKVVTAGNPDNIKKSKANFRIRVIAFVILLLLPFLIRMILNLMDNPSRTIELLKCIVE